MSETSLAFAQALAEVIRDQVLVMTKAIDEPPNQRVWLDQEAFERYQGVLQKLSPGDRHALFVEFGTSLLHSALGLLEQRAVHPRTHRLALVDADTGDRLRADLQDLLMDSARALRVVP